MIVKKFQLQRGGRSCILTPVTPAPARKLMRAAKSGAGFLCLGVFLLVQTVAMAPSIHAWVHPDACDPGHECAVTLLVNGQVHCPTTIVEAAKVLPVLVSAAPVPCVDFVSADIRLLPSRGPPA
jgi:hypothetical protein